MAIAFFCLAIHNHASGDLGHRWFRSVADMTGIESCMDACHHSV